VSELVDFDVAATSGEEEEPRVGPRGHRVENVEDALTERDDPSGTVFVPCLSSPPL
jgi:hypothetical protein